MADKDEMAEAREAFEQASSAENDNRNDFIDDLKFARLEQQWPEKIKQDRIRYGKPVLTLSKMNSFIRQVVNDARQNKPSVKVHPADGDADPETAAIYDGLIRNIEVQSSADVAYDTAIENAVSGGFGYWRIGVDYTHDDTFDMDISIDRVADPLLVYGDPNSTAADSSDWNTAFIVERLTTRQFETQYKGAEKVNWDTDYKNLGEPWYADDTVMVAEWWRREEVEKQLLLMSDGTILDEERYAICKDYLDAMMVTVAKQRTVKSWQVTQKIMTGAETLETTKWIGKYIPIVPVYGDEVWVEGKRYLRSLIRSAKDAQRNFNYWRTTTTELVALAPKAPYIGPKGAFKTDTAKWQTANQDNHAYIEFDGQIPPQRQPFTGVPAGALQEALNASDDMKAIIGLYDASLGARSNETSGKAITARQREGDVSTFHFIDNLQRAIRHTGRILIDLIPQIYTGKRIVRILGEDGQPLQKHLNTPVPVMDQNGQPMMDPNGQAITRVFDLNAGKYDLTVSTGPSYTTRREEAATQMTEMIRALPASAPIVGPSLVKNLDWPGADEIAKKLEALLPQPGQPDPAIAAAASKFQQEQAAANAKLENERAMAASKQQSQQQEQAHTEKMYLLEEKASALRVQELEAKSRLASQERQQQHEMSIAERQKHAEATISEHAAKGKANEGMGEAIVQLAQRIEMLAHAAAAPKRTVIARDASGRATHADQVPIH